MGESSLLTAVQARSCSSARPFRLLPLVLLAAFLMQVGENESMPRERCCFSLEGAHTVDGELQASLRRRSPESHRARMRAGSHPLPHPPSDHGSSGRQSVCPPGRRRATLCGRTSPGREEPYPMRFRYLLLPLAFAILGLTSGCHHRHCCWGGGCCCAPAPCCSPCGTCCGYHPAEGPMPPLAPTPAPMAAPMASPLPAPLSAPQMPLANPR